MDKQKITRIYPTMGKTFLLTGMLATLFSCATADKASHQPQADIQEPVLKLKQLTHGFSQTLYYRSDNQQTAYKDTHANEQETPKALNKSYKDTHANEQETPKASNKFYKDTHANEQETPKASNKSYKDTHATDNEKLAPALNAQTNDDTHTIELQLNEHQGISISNSQGKARFIAGSFVLASAEIAEFENKQWVSMVVFNNNTQHIEAYRLAPDTLDIQQQLTQSAKGSEAICAAVTAQGAPHIVNIDATGTLNQFEIHDNQFLPLRNFAIGPGMKSCSLDMLTHSIYLADEFAGVWKVNADIESELEKELFFHNANIAIEGVSTLSSNTSLFKGSLLGWVSPNKSGVWLQSQCQTEFITLQYDLAGVPQTIEPEFIHLAFYEYEKGPRISVIVDDDASGNFFSAELSSELSAAYFNHGCLSKDEEPIANAGSRSPKYALARVLPSAETQPVKNYGDAADDPAIWVNAQSPSQSRILGTDKKGALNTYDLLGHQQQSLAVGRVNNVDVGYNVAIANMNNSGETTFTDIAIASNRSHNSLSVFEIDKFGVLAHLGEIDTTLTDIYGMCLFVENGVAQVFANDTSGLFERYEVSFNKNKKAKGTLTQSFSLPSQPEGCVVDTHTNTAYFGEEGAGIWSMDISSTKHEPTFVSAIAPPVEADMEGLALFTVDAQTYLIASSQGNNSYAIYNINSKNADQLTLMGLIRITADMNNSIDGVSETDGLEVTNANLGGVYSEGLWVVQDGRNVMPSETQNFKLVSGTRLKEVIRNLVSTKH
jgi:3-phytase